MMKLTTLVAAAMAALSLAGTAHGQQIAEFRVGILGGENENDRLRANQCLVDRFEKLLGVPVKLYPAADYAGTMEGLKGGNLDYAELGASGYAGIYIDAPDSVEPVVTTKQTDGSTGYHSIMIARADSGIAKLDDMKGRTLGFADPNSTSGYLVPFVSLPRQGYPIDTFFGATKFAGGHEQAVLAVLNGDVDAAVTWASGVGAWEEGYSSGNLRKMVDKGLLDMSDIVELWQSPEIPNGPTVLRKSLPADVKAKVTASLLSLAKDDRECMYNIAAGEVDSYVPVRHEFYQTIIDARRAVIDNKTN